MDGRTVSASNDKRSHLRIFSDDDIKELAKLIKERPTGYIDEFRWAMYRRTGKFASNATPAPRRSPPSCTSSALDQVSLAGYLHWASQPQHPAYARHPLKTGKPQISRGRWFAVSL